MTTLPFDQYLAADHRHCDALLGQVRSAALAGNWALAHSACAALCAQTRAHFAAEEEILFPAFEAATGVTQGPTRVMRMEHAEARLLLDDLAAAVAASDVDEVRGHGEALLLTLQQHNMKEEHILYPAARESCQDQAEALALGIAARREAP